MAVIPPDQLEIREQLGTAVGVWMRRNKWSQQVFHDWALAVGSEGPWNSQISLLLRGKHDPKALFWLAMGRFNEAVAEQDLRPIKDQKLKGRLLEATPFLTAEGEPATATDFFGMFVGEVAIPQDYLQAIVLTKQECIDLGDACRSAFKAKAKSEMMSPKEAFASFSQTLEGLGLSAREQQQFKDVLSEWGEWSPDDIVSMSIDPLVAVKSWAA